MKPKDDPTGDLYTIMDKAGMTGGNLLQGKVAMVTLVNKMRQRMHRLLSDYIEKRDTIMFEKGREYERQSRNTD